jgi:hypothetical protein
MWRTGFGILLILHGLVTIVIWVPTPSPQAPTDTSKS